MGTKYYKLEELHVGMRVSVESLDKIVGTRILLDRETFDYRDRGEGTIVFIGNEDYDASKLSPSTIIPIYNAFDVTDESIDIVVTDFGEELEETSYESDFD